MKRKNGQTPAEKRWGDEKRERFCRAWERGDGTGKMASDFDVSTSTIYDIVGRLGLGRRGVVAQKKPTKCLSCQAEFMSEGIHNRICVVCKKRGAWRTGNDFETSGLVT